MRLINIFVITSLLLSGCATANKMNNVQIGMTESEVIKTIGNPASVSAKDECKYLNYSLSETDDQAGEGITVPYYVRLINGRVDSYGRLGDFDSTQKSTMKIETDENIKTQTGVKSSEKEDLYSELIKLKQLKEEGLITQEEFEKEKKELLAKY